MSVLLVPLNKANPITTPNRSLPFDSSRQMVLLGNVVRAQNETWTCSAFKCQPGNRNLIYSSSWFCLSPANEKVQVFFQLLIKRHRWSFTLCSGGFSLHGDSCCWTSSVRGAWSTGSLNRQHDTYNINVLLNATQLLWGTAPPADTHGDSFWAKGFSWSLTCGPSSSRWEETWVFSCETHLRFYRF